MLSTDGFDAFINENNLKELATADLSDEEITRLFLAADFPEWLQSQPTEKQTAYLSHVKLESPLTIKIDGKKSTPVILL